MRGVILASIALLLLVHVTLAQDADSTSPADEAKTDWSSFDPVAALAAGGQPPKELPFKRLWTTKERVRLLHGLAISANGERVLAIASDGRCQVYHGKTGKPLVKVSAELPGCTHTALSPDGSRGAVGLLSTEVVIFDTATGKVLHRHAPSDASSPGRTPKIAALQFTADGQHLTWFATNGRFERADLASGQRINHVFPFPQDDTAASLIGLSPDGLVAACQPSSLKNLLSYLVLPAPGSDEEPEVLERKFGDQPPVTIALSPNLVAFQTVQGRFVVQSSLHQRLPPGERKSSTSNIHLTASRTGAGLLQISSDEKWAIALGRGQAEIRRLDVPLLPSLHNLDVESTAQMALAADVLRVAVVDQDGRLTVLALDETPNPPIWDFQNTVIKLVKERQFALLDKLSDAMQDDPEPFSFNPSCPKHNVFVSSMLRFDAWDRPTKHGVIDEWLADQPESKLARLLLVKQLVSAGWAARGSGFANTVTEEGFNVFRQRVTEAHLEIDELLEQDRPPPEAFMWLFDIAKAEGWTEEECLAQSDRAMELSPQYLMPHLCLTEKLLMRWGGEADSSAMYAARVSDKIGGPAGDAMYAQLIARIASYEDRTLLRGALGIDWERAYKGCRALQDMPQRRTLGMLIELELADAVGDDERFPRLAQIIDRERTPFHQRTRLTRYGYEKLYRENVDRVVPNAEEEEMK